jgi:hypothetical protein
MKSHVRGWSLIWAQRLDADISEKHSDMSDYDKVYIDHGVNFSGSLNLFGGLTDDVIDRINNVEDAWYRNTTSIIFLDIGSLECNYEEQMLKRIGQNTSSSRLTKDYISRIEQMFDNAKTLTMHNIQLPKAIIGDSHCAAFSIPEQKVLRQNGKTLWSVLSNERLKTYIERSMRGKLYNVNEIDICLGSVDIRHHAIRCHLDAKTFAQIYAEQIKEAQDYFETAINPCAPVPIEYEERKIPKTGQYDGKNFSGTRQQRLDFTKHFIDTLDSYCCDFDVIIPPEHWYTMDGRDYAEQIMELSSSVHIAPLHYRSISKW